MYKYKTYFNEIFFLRKIKYDYKIPLFHLDKFGEYSKGILVLTENLC